MTIPKESQTPELEQALLNLIGKKLSMVFSLPEDGEVIEKEIAEGEYHFLCKVEDIYPVIGDFPSENVLRICTKYFSLLENLVGECEKIYGP